MYKIISYLATIEISGFYCFIIMSRYQYEGAIHYLPLLLTLIAVIFITYLKASTLTYKQSIYVSLAISLIFIIAYLFLGFAFFSGLVKDNTFFSLKTLSGSLIVLFIGTVVHFLLLTLFKKIRLEKVPDDTNT